MRASRSSSPANVVGAGRQKHIYQLPHTHGQILVPPLHRKCNFELRLETSGGMRQHSD